MNLKLTIYFTCTNVLNVAFNWGGVNHEKLTKVAYCSFDQNDFCSGSVFVPLERAREDSPWIVSWVHNEETDASKVSSDFKTMEIVMRFRWNKEVLPADNNVR